MIAIQRPLGDPEPPPFRVTFERLHMVERKPFHLVSPHLHRHPEIMLPTTGRYRARINGEQVEVPAGGAVLVAGGDRHEDLCHGPVAFFSLVVRLEPGPEPGLSRPILAAEAPISVRAVPVATAAHDVATRLAASGAASDACTARIQDALAAELIWQLVRLLPRAHLASDLLPEVERGDFAAALAGVFARHLQGRPTAARLAYELDLAERTLTARCRELLGASPLKLFRRRQMQHARALLSTSGLGVAEVAAHLGFASPFHFSTVYKRVYGIPPSHAGSDMPVAGTRMVPGRRQRL